MTLYALVTRIIIAHRKIILRSKTMFEGYQHQ
jgi:hypothetical protein